MADTLTITVNRIQMGQPRRYADSVYIADLSFGHAGHKWTPPLKVVVQTFQLYVQNIPYDPLMSDKRDWNGWFTKIDLIESSETLTTWHVEAVVPYTD